MGERIALLTLEAKYTWGRRPQDEVLRLLGEIEAAGLRPDEFAVSWVPSEHWWTLTIEAYTVEAADMVYRGPKWALTGQPVFAEGVAAAEAVDNASIGTLYPESAEPLRKMAEETAEAIRDWADSAPKNEHVMDAGACLDQGAAGPVDASTPTFCPACLADDEEE